MSKLQINNLFFYWYVQDTVSSVALTTFCNVIVAISIVSVAVVIVLQQY